MSERGTVITMFDYAHFSETLLGLGVCDDAYHGAPDRFHLILIVTGKPLILFDRTNPENRQAVIQWVRNRFGTQYVVGVWRNHIRGHLEAHGITHLWLHKYGLEWGDPDISNIIFGLKFLKGSKYT